MYELHWFEWLWLWFVGNAGVVTALSSLVVAVASLAFAIDQGHAVRSHYRLSVQPHLQFERRMKSNEDKEKAGLYLANKGLGPARIKEMKVRSAFRSDDLPTNSYAALKAIVRQEIISDSDVEVQGLDSGDAVDAKDKLGIVTLNYEAWNEEFQTFLDCKLIVEIEYESFYGDVRRLKWVAGRSEGH